MQDMLEPIELTASELDAVVGGFLNNFLNVVVADNGNANGNLNGSGNLIIGSANRSGGIAAGNGDGNGNGNTVAVG